MGSIPTSRSVIRLGARFSPQIAVKLDISESTVWRRLKKLGLKTQRACTHESGAVHKECIRCGETKPIEKFPLAGGKKDEDKYRRRYCMSCYGKSKKVRRAKVRAWLDDYKKTLKCETCGKDDFRVLEFHHKNGAEDKEGDIATLVSSGWSKNRIMKEVEKCKTLCACCHRILHYEERNGE